MGGTETTVAAPTALPRWIIGLVLIGSGFTTLAYEMLWFRALRLFVGNSTYAPGAVLIVFLCGLGLGALPLRWVLRRGRPERDLCLCQLLIAGLGLWAVVCMALVLVHPSVNEYVNIFLPQVRLQPWARMAIIAAVALLTMLPATLVMGLSFPLASRMFVGDVRKLGRLVGGAYLLANVGSILGGVLAAVILLPVLGVNRGTQACALLNVALAALVAWRVKGIGEFAYGAAAVGLLFLAVPSSIPQAGEGNLADWRVAFVREAEQGTVHVMEMPHDSGKKVMLIDGCMIGCSSTFVESTMHLKQSAVAHLPMALQPRASRALTVGLGSASTLRTLASYAQLDTVDCVEINEAVIEGSVLFAESEVYGDPRVRVIHDDAVHYLLGARGAYDVIVSDGKQDPFYSGNAVLLCREFYQYARASLRDGGVFAQWMSLATLPEDFAVIFRTISDAFPPRRDVRAPAGLGVHGGLDDAAQRAGRRWGYVSTPVPGVEPARGAGRALVACPSLRGWYPVARGSRAGCDQRVGQTGPRLHSLPPTRETGIGRSSRICACFLGLRVALEGRRTTCPLRRLRSGRLRGSLVSRRPCSGRVRRHARRRC